MESTHVFLRLFAVSMLSRAFHLQHVFPRFSPFQYFPALFSGNMNLVRLVIGFYRNDCLCHHFGFELS